MKKAQKLLKVSKRRDYYKILGVPRSATKKQILKAYRTMAANYHPDKVSAEGKKEAEKKFMEISAAKEVLSDDSEWWLSDSSLHLFYVQISHILST